MRATEYIKLLTSANKHLDFKDSFEHPIKMLISDLLCTLEHHEKEGELPEIIDAGEALAHILTEVMGLMPKPGKERDPNEILDQGC